VAARNARCTSNCTYVPAAAKNRLILDLQMQGCQMIHFETKNSNLGKFGRVSQCKMLIKAIGHLIYLMAIWYICWLFGMFFPILEYYCRKKNLATLCRWAKKRDLFLEQLKVSRYLFTRGENCGQKTHLSVISATRRQWLHGKI
jgi:hypothetical protein